LRRQAGVVGAAGGAGAAGAGLCAARGKRWKPEPPVEEGDVGGIPGVEAHDGDRLASAVVAGGLVVEAGELRGTEGAARIAERLARPEMRLHAAGVPEAQNPDDVGSQVRRQRGLVERGARRLAADDEVVEAHAERLLGGRDRALATDEEPVRRTIGDPKALLLEIGDDSLLLPNGGPVMRDELLLREEAVVSRRAGILNVFDEARQGGSPADRQ